MDITSKKGSVSEQAGLKRSLGLKESISMTIGTVVGVGLFTCGSSQIGAMGPWIIVATTISLLISIWPCLLYGEMGAALPFAGGTYNYAKYGANRILANIAGWNYIIAVIAICSGETLAFSNYFTILLEALGIDISFLDPRIIACILVLAFIVLNYKGIQIAGKWQNIFVFFFWGCSVLWFIYMFPQIHFSYFTDTSSLSFPAFGDFMYILGLVWWCYTGFETAVSMGGEVKFPQITLPRALKISVFLVFACNALFQWFLVGLVPSQFYPDLLVAVAPYADGLKMAGIVGAPIVILCIGIAFGGDLSTINPGIAAPSRYVYTMAQDKTLPKIFAKAHPKFDTPNTAIILVGIINFLLIATNSINYIASVSLFSLLVCYIIGCISYIGLKKKEPDMNRPYKAPAGVFGSVITIVIYAVLLLFVDKAALITGVVITILSIIYYFVFTKKTAIDNRSIKDEICKIEVPTVEQKAALDKEYKIWKYITIAVTILSFVLYIVPML